MEKIVRAKSLSFFVSNILIGAMKREIITSAKGKSVILFFEENVVAE